MASLNKAYIRSLCRERFYARGQALFEDGAVSVKKIIASPESIVFDLRVQGSRKRPYRVDGLYDRKKGELKQIQCECPAFYEYSGICKHCVAALLYVEEREEAEIEDRDGKRKASPKSLSKTPKARRTTPVIRQLLLEKQNQEIRLQEKREYSPVHLEPCLILDSGRLALEFKVGTNRMYIVKDVIDFGIRCILGKEFEYGKNLSFVHALENFGEESRPLVKFVMNWVEQSVDRHSLFLYDIYSSGVRRIQLNANEAEAFFLAAFPGPVRVRENGKENLRNIIKGAPERRLILEGTPEGLDLEFYSSGVLLGRNFAITVKEQAVYLEAEQDILPVIKVLEYAQEPAGKKAFIAREDVPAFCRSFLGTLEKVFCCEKKNFDAVEYGALSPKFRFYLDRPQEDVISCRAEALYGETVYNLLDGERELLKRDRAGELKAFEPFLCWQARPFEKTALIEGEESMYGFLTEGLAALEQQGELFATDAFKRLRIEKPPKITANLSLSGGLLDFVFSAESMESRELLEILSSYDRKKKYCRLKSGSFMDMENSGNIRAVLDLMEDLNLTRAQMEKGKISLPVYRAMYVDSRLRLGESEGLSYFKDRACRALLKNMKTVEDNDFSLPKSLEHILRPYQKYGFFWMKTLKSNGLGGILADDMGLGKTLQVISLLLSEKEETLQPEGSRRCLIVAPASLIYNWSREIQRFAPSLTVALAAGTAEQRRQLIESAAGCDVLLTSYDLLKRDQKLYEGLRFDCQIIDEAQYIKNYGTQAARAVKEVQSSFRLALTGTPVENRLSELWSIFDYLMPGFLYSYPVFRRKFELPAAERRRIKGEAETAERERESAESAGREAAAAAEPDGSRKEGETAKGTEDLPLKRLQSMIRPFVLRRLKRDVLKDLPDKIEKNIYASMGEEQKRFIWPRRLS